MFLDAGQVVQHPDPPLVDGFRSFPEILPGDGFAFRSLPDGFFSGEQAFSVP